MAETLIRPQYSNSILESLGEEIVRIITPVSTCMLLVVLLVTTLNSSPSTTPSSVTSVATIAYSETNSDSFWDKLKGALLNSLAFVGIITVLTFLLVLLFYFRCTKCLKWYMGFSSFVVLGLLGGEISLFLITHFSLPIDCVTFVIGLLNFSVVGMISVFLARMPILVTQAYLVVIGVLVAYMFTMLPEWTTWALLVAMALYDLVAVLLPVGPLRILVELAISRDEEIPALVYEARPVEHPRQGDRANAGRRLWRETMELGSTPNVNSSSSNLGDVLAEETRLVIGEEELPRDPAVSGMTAPLIQQQLQRTDEEIVEGIGLGSSGAIKLGLGDFIFYSVLVGRAAMYDYMTVYACYLAIIAGLGVTLMLLAFCRKALPALPFSIALGVIFYFLTYFLLEVFVVQCSVNLMMF